MCGLLPCLQSMTHACTASLCAAVQRCCSTWRAQDFGRKHWPAGLTASDRCQCKRARTSMRRLCSAKWTCHSRCARPATPATPAAGGAAARAGPGFGSRVRAARSASRHPAARCSEPNSTVAPTSPPSSLTASRPRAWVWSIGITAPPAGAQPTCAARRPGARASARCAARPGAARGRRERRATSTRQACSGALVHSRYIAVTASSGLLVTTGPDGLPEQRIAWVQSMPSCPQQAAHRQDMRAAASWYEARAAHTHWFDL